MPTIEEVLTYLPELVSTGTFDLKTWSEALTRAYEEVDSSKKKILESLAIVSKRIEVLKTAYSDYNQSQTFIQALLEHLPEFISAGITFFAPDDYSPKPPVDLKTWSEALTRAYEEMKIQREIESIQTSLIIIAVGMLLILLMEKIHRAIDSIQTSVINTGLWILVILLLFLVRAILMCYLRDEEDSERRRQYTDYCDNYCHLDFLDPSTIYSESKL
ncbi:uncharacterized protein LOC130912157 isoform X2 [Corythoichthys intestinalis]|uniref:uncharacterized protein LOC130912157 isoform X2 n=1 Tax=Corythoichthys intestinalis TaxID=161448 RepID=UPI0025A56A8C|nr:uncharacterized protein LOC130912157 isoform X2 [Corythoichthys intestinalis]